MKTIAIIAEFNPFHNGHLHLIEACKKELNADNCIVIMSGDFVQRGAPAILDKFTRAKMALSCGADIVIELPVYYSTGSAEYFAMGAVSLISKIGIVDYLCFGSECGNIDELKGAAKILYNESAEYKEELSILLQNGKNYPSARAMAVEKVSGFDTAVLSSPNNVLGIEYIRAINALGSSVFPHTIKRTGEDYNSSKMTELAGASAIRAGLLNQESEESLCISMPPACFDMIKKYKGKLATSNDLSHLLQYKLLLEKQSGFDKYLDISEDISNRIVSYIDNFKGYDDFCSLIKTKNITYTRVSRSLLHILLNITSSNMNEYKSDGFTSYVRILGMKKNSSSLVRQIKEKSGIPIFTNLKDAGDQLNPLQKRLFEETLTASSVYNNIFITNPQNEYRIKPVII